MRGLRGLDLAKPPGVAETIDWAHALAALGRQELDAEIVEQTLGSVLKYHEDLETVRDAALATLVEEARALPAERRSSGRSSTFGRVLREAGLEVGPGRVSDALPGLDPVELDAPGRRLLDAAPDARLPRRGPRGLRPRLRRVVPPRARAGAARGRRRRSARRVASGSRGRRGGGRRGGRRGEERASRVERRGDPARAGLLRAHDRSSRKLRRLIAELARARPAALAPPAPPPARHALDMRRLVRESLATGGDPVERAFRARIKTQPRS